jgi:hypothetical protein
MTTPAEAFPLTLFRRLAVKRGLLPGTLHGNHPADFAVVMAAATLAFEAQREYSEAEVNAVLKSWLAGAGAMLATDHVELRRWLVDCGLVVRDGFGRRYVRDPVPGAYAAALGALAGVDLAAIAREAVDADAATRAERKARWTSTRAPESRQQ